MFSVIEEQHRHHLHSLLCSRPGGILQMVKADRLLARFRNGRILFAVAVLSFSVNNRAADLKRSPDDHWAFKMPARARLPVPVDQAWAVNPIDCFVSARQRETGLKPNLLAERSVLLRRVYLNLIGLPPRPQEIAAFLNDASPQAYERVVDRLLRDPRYGERWGRHWMDVWRYSDWYGTEGKGRITNSQLHMWRWRDWIVESLNHDKPYNRMIIEMIAGDEIAPGDPDTIRATGFLARNHFRLDRNVPLMASVEHTSRAFLGLTLECSRCHEHKYDPITHADYYRFRAFFEPMGIRLDRVRGENDTEKDGMARVFDAIPTQPTYLYAGGDERRPAKDKPLTAGLPGFFESQYLGGNPLKYTRVSLRPEEFNPWLDENIRGLETRNLESEIARLESRGTKEKITSDSTQAKLNEKALATARARLTALHAVIAADRAKQGKLSKTAREEKAHSAALAQRELKLRETEENILKAEQKIVDIEAQVKAGKAKAGQLAAAKSDLKKQKAVLKKVGETKLTSKYSSWGEVYPEFSTGRRTALARWLAGSNNPLTARVAVNHVWMRHFGEPLVPTVYEFGVAGKPPTHPELLDWLAVEFVESGWSMKHLHRLMVTSRAYRLSSSNAGADKNQKLDPDNRTLWRMNPRRMEAEVVRDSMLYLAGQLEQQQLGPDIPADQGDANHRRSIYFKHAGVGQMPILELFDGASVIECYQRPVSIVPQQALGLANGPLSLAMSRTLARELSTSASADVDFISSAYLRILNRKPNLVEATQCESFLGQQARMLDKPSQLTLFTVGAKSLVSPAKDSKQRARENLVHVLFNHNDYVTIR